MDEAKKTLMIVDSNALVHRAYHALPAMYTNDAVLVNAVYGFCLIFFKAIAEINPDYVVATFDVKGKTFRHDEFADYKATREKKPDSFYHQIPIIKDILKSLGALVLEKEGFEADDIIGTVAEKVKNENIETVIVTGDLDTLQLLRENLKVWTLKVGISNSVVYDINRFEKKYGLKVDQFVDFKALKGDPSDNIPGVAGVGEKTAINILLKNKSLDDLYKNIDNILKDSGLSAKDKKLYLKLKESEEEAFFSKHLAMIKRDVDVDFSLEKAKFKLAPNNETLKIFRELQFNSLIAKLNTSMINEVSGAGLENSSKKDVKILESFELFKKELKKEKLFIFDAIYLNNKEEDFLLFFEKENYFNAIWCKKEDIIKNINEIKNCDLITFDSKKLYYDFDGSLDELMFYDLKIAFWLLDANRKDYTFEAMIKKFHNKNLRAIAFLDNYEVEDWAVVLDAIFRIIWSKIVNLKVDRVFLEIERPLTRALVKMEKNGIKLDVDYLKQIKDKIKLELLKLEEEIYELSLEKFNINSPKQLSEILFEKLKISSKGLAKTSTKKISTNSDELEKILDSHLIIPKVLKYRELAKLKNSFLDTLPNFVNEKTNRVHTSFVQTGTATGRLSSDTPNLQNIPVKGENGILVRKAFIAEKGFDLASFDYSQMELRIAAKLSKDEKMIKAFVEGKDFHRYTASLVNKVDYEKVTKEQRDKAKALNFGIIYGMGFRAFSLSANINKEEAKDFIKEYFDIYKGLKNFMEDLKIKAREKGYSETLYGRKRFLPFIGSMGMQGAMDERIAINMPVQGLAADIIKKAMVKIDEYLKKNNLEDKIKMILQIHDELIFEVSKKMTQSEIFDTIEKIMEENEFDILLKVDFKRSDNWGDLK